MKKIQSTCLNDILVVLIFLFTISCNNRNNTPFPKDDRENSVPVSKPLKFSATQPLQWKEISRDSIKPPKTVHFDMDKLPVKPFMVNDFKEFTKPVLPRKLDWDNIPDSLINFDTIPARPFKISRTVLPKPVITRAGIPKLLAGTTSGILQFGEEEGLPGSVISASLVDKHGMVWLATDKGLCRYTGEQLYTWSFLRRQSNGNISSIISMTEDLSGKIWISTSEDGIYAVDVSKGTLWHDQSNLKDINDIICDHSGNLWVACLNKGLCMINIEKETIKKIPWNRDSKTDYIVLTVKEDKYHNIWIGCMNQIGIIDPDRKKLKKLGKNEGLKLLASWHFFEDSKGEMWVGSYAREINCISFKNKTVSTFNANSGFNGRGVKFEEDKIGKLWVIQDDSIFIINKQRTACKVVVTNAKMLGQLNGTSLRDANGNILIGTLDKGAIIIDPDGCSPEHLDSKSGLDDNNVWGLLEDKNGHIWIATHKGVNIYDQVKNQIGSLENVQGLGTFCNSLMEYDQNTIYSGSGKGFSLINMEKNSLTNYTTGQGLNFYCRNGVKDSCNNLWITSTQGFVVYNTEKNTMKKLDKSSGLRSNILYKIIDDKHGNFWTTSDSGTVVINPKAKTMQYLSEKEGILNNSSGAITMRNNNEIWIGTNKGISIVDIDKNTITHLTSEEGLVPESIFSLVAVGNIVYAGSQNGLIEITCPDQSDSTAGKNNHWSFFNYGKKEGFPYNDYNGNTIIAAKNGQIWLGVTPVLTILTQQPNPDTAPAKVFITGMSVMDQSPSWERTMPPFNIPVGLELPFNQNFVNFSYSNADITGREKIVYRYILEGADNKWSDITNQSFSKNYYNLFPGKYTFKVCSKGFNGVWSRPAEMSFTILPPWWKTWWAYCIYGLFLMAAIRAMNHYQKERTIRIEREKSQKRELDQAKEIEKAYTELKSTQAQLIQSEKMASLGELTAGIAHEIQNPLNFVNNFSEVNKELLLEMKDEFEKGNLKEVKSLVNDVIENEDKILHHGKRADAIVKGMLQHSRSSSGVKEPTDINALADEYLRLAYHGLRAKDKSFNATMNIDFDESIGKVNIIPQDFGRVILNLVNNAFYAVAEKKKSADLQGFQNLEGLSVYEPTVWVTTKRTNNKVELFVKDNGNGIPKNVLDKIFQPFFTTKPTGQGTGLGLSMSYDIIKAHGGELKVQTNNGEGAEFVIVLTM